jgi:hypothetical protein
MNRYYSEEGLQRISQLLNDRRFNLVHLEGYYLMQLLPAGLDLPVLLVEHNIEYLICKEQFCRHPVRIFYLIGVNITTHYRGNVLFGDELQK